jgi:aminopeptidase N
VAHSGNLQEVTNGEGTSTYKICQDAVRDFAVVLSDKFVKKTQAAGDVTINYYYFADLEPEVSVAAVLSALQFMQEKVGKYPYSQLSVVETDFCYGGMEYPNLVMVSSGSQDYTTAAAHEVIHQWFYGVVGNDQIEHAWMDEGLTEFLTLAYLDYSLTTPLADSIKERNRAYLSFVDVLKNYFKELNTSYRPTYGYKSEQEYQYITYLKGSLMFNKAYEIMGKDRFYKALTHYFNNNAGKIAAPADLINSFTKANNSDMSEFFKAFIEGKDMLFTQ